MGKISEELQRILQAKSDIKDAIEQKGVTVGDIKLDAYADKIKLIEGAGITEEANLEFYEYLQGNGVSYIKTNYIPKSNTVVIIEDSGLIVANEKLFGARTGSANKNFSIYRMSTEVLRCALYNTSYSFTYNNTSERHEIHFVGNGLVGYFNGDAVNTHEINRTTVDYEYPLWIYAMNLPGEEMPGNNYHGKIYLFTIYEEQEAVMKLLPCKYNGEAGLYDIVNKIFYGSANDTDFTVGGRKLLSYNGSVMPNYIIYEGLNFDGNCSIETDINLNIDYVYEITFKQATTVSSLNFLCGHLTDNYGAAPLAVFYGYGSNKFNMRRNGVAVNIGHNNTNKTTIIDERNRVYYDAEYTRNVVNDYDKDYNFCIGYNLWNTAIKFSNFVGTLYEIKIKLNGNLEHHLVPALSLSENSLGIYDKVTGKFYKNTKTGSFSTVGNIISIGSEESSGNDNYKTILDDIKNILIDKGMDATNDYLSYPNLINMLTFDVNSFVTLVPTANLSVSNATIVGTSWTHYSLTSSATENLFDNNTETRLLVLSDTNVPLEVTFEMNDYYYVGGIESQPSRNSASSQQRYATTITLFGYNEKIKDYEEIYVFDGLSYTSTDKKVVTYKTSAIKNIKYKKYKVLFYKGSGARTDGYITGKYVLEIYGLLPLCYKL